VMPIYLIAYSNRINPKILFKNIFLETFGINFQRINTYQRNFAVFLKKFLRNISWNNTL
jgi:hypothetical protein